MNRSQRGSFFSRRPPIAFCRALPIDRNTNYNYTLTSDGILFDEMLKSTGCIMIDALYFNYYITFIF